MMNLVGQGVLTTLAQDYSSRFPNKQTFADFLQQMCGSSSYWTRSQTLESIVAFDKNEGEDDLDLGPEC